MDNKCGNCGAQLLTEVESQEKLLELLHDPGVVVSPDGTIKMSMSTSLEGAKARNSVGVACKECGAVYCVACMQEHGKPHPSSGGLGCLECGGAMTQYRGD